MSPPRPALHTALDSLLSEPGAVLAQVARHAGHYANLTQLEAELAAGRWVRRSLAAAVALLSATMALVLGGVAVMLAASPQAGGQGWPVAYWAVPAVPTVLALIAGVIAFRDSPPAFGVLRQQLQHDFNLLVPAHRPDAVPPAVPASTAPPDAAAPQAAPAAPASPTAASTADLH